MCLRPRRARLQFNPPWWLSSAALLIISGVKTPYRKVIYTQRDPLTRLPNGAGLKFVEVSKEGMEEVGAESQILNPRLLRLTLENPTSPTVTSGLRGPGHSFTEGRCWILEARPHITLTHRHHLESPTSRLPSWKAPCIKDVPQPQQSWEN